MGSRSSGGAWFAIGVALLWHATASASLGWFQNVGPGARDTEGGADVALGDLDGDGDLDAYVANDIVLTSGLTTTAVPDRILENVDGTLVPAGDGADAAAPTAGIEVAIVDVDGDGDNDVIVAGTNVYSGPGGMNTPSPTRVYRNSGSGPLNAARFSIAQSLSGDATCMAVADWDGDGDPDIALARENGTFEAWTNQGGAQSGTAGSYLRTQIIAGVAFQPAQAIALGQFVGDARLDLAYEVADTHDVAIRAGAAGSQPFPALTVNVDVTYPGGFQPVTQSIRELVAGNLDDFGRDDLLVATTLGATVFYATGADQFVETTSQFPNENIESAAIADLNGDGRDDLVLGRFSDYSAPGNVRYVGNLGIDDFVDSAQCFGLQRVLVAVTVGDVTRDGNDDLVVVSAGDFGADGRSDGITAYRNDAAFGLNSCCAAESAAFGIFNAFLPGVAAKAMAPIKAMSQASVDLGALRRLRAESMALTPDGQRMTARYDQYSAEVVALLVADPALRLQARDLLALWRNGIVQLNRWRGRTVFVTQGQVDAMDAFLNALSAAGSAGLAQMIADERALQPPFQDFVGMTMDEFRETTIDFPITFRDGFEN